MTDTRQERTRDRLLYLLKTRGPQSAAQLAKRLALTAMAVRLHLYALHEDGQLTTRSAPQRIGRPRKIWSLTRAGQQRFPESYGDLAIDLLREARQQFGSDGIEKLLEARMRTLTETYRQRMPTAKASLSQRVRALARLRSVDGYMAEVTKHSDGSFSLIENHCPICSAATLCIGLCATELRMFEDLLGGGVAVERTEHVLSDSRRCTYRITPKKLSGTSRPAKR